MVTVKGIDKLQKRLSALAGKRLRSAASSALNSSLMDARSAEQREMRAVFDRPTPATMKSVYAQLGSPEDVAGAVGLIDPTETVGDISGGSFVPRKAQEFVTPIWLRAEISGGLRRAKKFEKMLRAIGALPQDMFCVPAKGAWLDQYGNVPHGEIVKILSDLRSFRETGYAMNRGKRKSRGYYRNFQYFVMRRGGRPAGIWARETSSQNVQPVFLFVKQPQYKPRLSFAAARREIGARFPRHFALYWSRALGK